MKTNLNVETKFYNHTEQQ